MSQYITAAPDSTRAGSDSELSAAAANGLMHWSECQTDGVILDREFFATREEAEKSALDKSVWDADNEIEYEYVALSMWRDEDGDLIAAETEDETPES